MVGVLNDRVFTGADGIRYSLATVVLTVGGVLTLSIALGQRHYSRAVVALERAMTGRADAHGERRTA